MPRKNAMRDNVSVVRSRLPHLSNLPREKIELALLYYESNVDETVEAFKRNGAVEALSGWTEMNNGRGNNSAKRSNNKAGNRDNKSSSQTPPSNGILRPSQRVSNIFQTFAEGGIPTITTNGITTVTNAAPYSPSSLSSSSVLEQSSNHLQTSLSTDLSFYPYLSQDSMTNHSESSLHVNESTRNEYHDTSNGTTNTSATTDDIDLSTNHMEPDNEPTNETNGYNGKSKRRKNPRQQNGSTSSGTYNHEQPDQPISTDTQHVTAVTKSSSSSADAPSSSNGNRKVLTKSTKDLQRQTSTLTNVELSFENEIKSSIKRIDDVFKQVREIIKEREVELYLEMDKVKEQGLSIIHRRQQRALELRQRVDSCDRLEPLEIDTLRTDIKQFVTDRRYDLGEELTSSHRFEYDQTLIEALKNFGTVLRIDRKCDRARTLSTSSALVEQNGTSANTTDTNLSETSVENTQAPLTNGRVSASSSNELLSPAHQQPLPQRISNRQYLNGNTAGDRHQNSPVAPQTNGHHHYYEDANNYQTTNRRRPPPQQYPPYHNGNGRRPRAIPPSNNNNNNNNNNRRNGLNNSETSNTYRRPRPPPPQTMVSPISN